MTSLNLALPPSGASALAVHIRHVRTHEEFVSCVELQLATWGASFGELVPASVLKITQRLGGVTAGAFADDGTLIGFVFGITGIENGEIVHWSDMLAVRDDVQSNGVGRRLKEFQRDAVRALGAKRMYWTFDPLVARNAHFNLNRLGVRISEYVPDMYGTNTGSSLHSGLGTDRFIAVWPINEDTAVAESNATERTVLRALPASQSIPTLNAMIDEDDGDALRFAASLPPYFRVEIPSDIFRVNAESPGQARRWRETTRRAFQWALANGYRVDQFERGDPAGVGAYLLARASSQSTL